MHYIVRLKVIPPIISVCCFLVLQCELIQVNADTAVNCSAVGAGIQEFKGGILDLLNNCTEAKFNLYINPSVSADKRLHAEYLDAETIRYLEIYLKGPIPGPTVPNSCVSPPVSANSVPSEDSKKVCQRSRICWKRACKLVEKCVGFSSGDCRRKISIYEKKRVKRANKIIGKKKYGNNTLKPKRICKKKWANVTFYNATSKPKPKPKPTTKPTPKPTTISTPAPGPIPMSEWKRGCYTYKCWVHCPRGQIKEKEWCWMGMPYGDGSLSGPVKCETDKDCQGPNLGNWWCADDEGMKLCEKDLETLLEHANEHFQYFVGKDGWKG